MDILMIIGESIYANSSSNIFKRRIIDEIANSNNLVVLMDDNSMNIKQVTKYEHNRITFIEYSRLLPVDRIIGLLRRQKAPNIGDTFGGKTKIEPVEDNQCKEFLKKIYNKLYSKHIEIFYKKYRYNSAWLHRVRNYESDVIFEAVISISHPPVSHKVASDIISSGNVKCQKWLQIWFEPWFQVPLKKNKTGLIIEEEKALLKDADAAFYVNSIFWNNQKEMFPEYADKMEYIDLPVVFENGLEGTSDNVKPCTVGYFGNYYSSIRNIKPFYNVIRAMDNMEGYIIGDSNLSLKPTNNLVIKSRVSYEEIKKYKNEVAILVILSNMAEQIPGKAYDYSSSNKYVLFILDSNEKVRKGLKKYFDKFNRYVFCENTEEDIRAKINDIVKGKYLHLRNKPIQEFHVKNIVKKLLNNFSEE